MSFEADFNLCVKEKKITDYIGEIEAPVIFFGCGNNARIVAEILKKKNIVPEAYCDNNPDKWQTFIDGVPVSSYNHIRKIFKNKKYIIVITTSISHAIAIEKQLKEAGEKNPILHLEKPFKVDDEFLSKKYLMDNKDAFQYVYDVLSDSLSKEIMIQNLEFRVSGNKLGLVEYCDGNSFFDENIIPIRDDYEYVDIGAFTGDTIIRFYGFVGGKYKGITGIEADPASAKKIERLAEFGRMSNATVLNMGCWNESGELKLYTVKDNSEAAFDSSNFFIDLNHSLPDSVEVSLDDCGEIDIHVDTLDNILGDRDCSLIKINALAADLQCLQGAEQIIRRCHPVIVGEYGARKENLTEMIKMIKRFNNNYNIYLRVKEIFGDYKTIYIAVDNSK